MKIYYNFLILSTLMFLVEKSYAQTGTFLKGRLQDEKGEAVSFANIALLQSADSALVTGSVTDVEGNFKIKSPEEGTYFLKLSAIGYETLYTEKFRIQSGGEKDFGNLILKEDIQKLDEVTVQALRPTIVTEVDKMVVSVEGTAMAAGSNALDVLSKSPGIWIDQDGNIQLNGKGGVRIMIDGRVSYLSAKELQNLLESMSAENIKDIEIITNPSAKYDAQGTAGIININFKKNTISGINGSVYSGYQYNSLHGYSSGINLNMKKNKWNSFANFDLMRRVHIRDSRMIREFNSESGSTHFDQDGSEKVIRQSPALKIGTDYDINDKHSIGGLVNLYRQNSAHDFSTGSYLTGDNPEENLYIDAVNLFNGNFTSGTFNIHYVGKLDSAGTKISADADYVRLNDIADGLFTNSYRNLSSGNIVYDQLKNYNPSIFDIYSFKVDFEKPFKNSSKFEAGLKLSNVQSDNELNFYIVEDGADEFDERRSSHFIYRENIYAGYVNYKTKLGKKWNVQGGLRAEQTIAEGLSVTLNTTTPRRYLDFFPSIFVQQKVNDNYSISYNYSRRIDRPHYESLNPFLFYLDPYTTAQGNPYLRPQYTNSFQFTQTIKQSYNLTFGYSHTKDFMAEVPEQDNATSTTVFMQRNVDSFRNFNATLIVPVRVMKGWEMNNTINSAFQSYSTYLGDLKVEVDNFFYMAQSNHNIQLPYKIKMEVNAGYQGPVAYGLYRIEANWWIDTGFKRSFVKDKLDFSVNFTDIFRTRYITGGANIDGNVNWFDQYRSAQSVRVNLRYRFSKGQNFEAKSYNKRIEELNRAGGN